MIRLTFVLVLPADLPLLVEIYPKQQSLLGFNVNSGRKIALRLRHASNHNDFLDQDSIVETMLHELAHNLRGPHDDIFFQHLDTLTREWYELQTSSSGLLPGQGFLTEGARLGGAAISLDPTIARQRAAEMAERRKRMAELMENGAGRRLGGDNASSPASLAAARAEAAERRRNITYNCPSSSLQDTAAAAQEQAEEELLHGIQVITIGDEDSDNDQRGSNSRRASPALKKEASSSDEDDLVIVDVKKAVPKKRVQTRSDSTPSHLVKQTRAAAALRSNLLTKESRELAASQQSRESSTSSHVTFSSRSWNCQRCTLLNSSVALICQACDDIRPGLEHWICSHCQHRMLGDDTQYWLCTKCSRIKTA
jgi:hypothetical protein